MSSSILHEKLKLHIRVLWKELVLPVVKVYLAMSRRYAQSQATKRPRNANQLEACGASNRSHVCLVLVHYRLTALANCQKRGTGIRITLPQQQISLKVILLRRL